MFRLTKWYLDLVTDEAAAVIVYAASLEWHNVRIRYASRLVAIPGATPDEQRSWTRVDLPRERDATLRFEHAGLRLAGEWRPQAEPIDALLLDDASGQIRWNCVQPNATATLELGGRTFAGQGYAECLRMTCLPSALPFRTLRWGRFTSPAHTIVWIDWSEGQARKWIWVDGQDEPGATLGEDEIGNLCGGRRLLLAPERDLCDRRVLQVISRRLPALRTLPIGRIRNLQEIKRLARGTLYRDGTPLAQGWTIHEVVTW